MRRTYGLLVAGLLYAWTLVRGSSATPGEGKAPKSRKQTPAAAEPDGGKPEKERSSPLEWEPESAVVDRRALGTLLVACAFVIGMAGGGGFLFVYWTGGGNLWLGGCLALFLGGFGAMLVLWAHWLMPVREESGPREVLESSPEERLETLDKYRAGVEQVQRRSLLKWMAAGGSGLFAAILISFLRAFGPNPYQALFTTVWKHGQRLMTIDGKPVSIHALQPGNMVVVFPQDSIGEVSSQTILIRVKERMLHLPKGRENWAPMGYIAYSRVCTHAGCPVGMYEPNVHLLLCPCHQSTFDVLRAAKPTGGPAARPLPQLPLYVGRDGNLRAGGGFTTPPGPGFWGMPT